MEEKNDSENISMSKLPENHIQVENLDGETSQQFNHLDPLKDETSSLIEDMPVEVNTTESTPSPETKGAESRRKGKLSACYEVRRGCEVARKKVRRGCGSYWSKTCSVNTVKKTFPISTWIPRYRPKTLKSDLIAGLTVGLTVIPQGMAYAALAGLELQYGLYSAFMGCFVYCFMGTSKDITMGPTAIMSILVSEYAHDPWKKGDHGESEEETTNVQLAIMLTFLCGAIQILMTFFRLGFIVRFISHPVITGFTSAAAIVITMTQLKKIFGITTPRGFFLTLYNLLKNLGQTKVFDLTLGISCMIVLFLLKYAKEKWSRSKEEDKLSVRILRTILWFSATSRNAVVVVVSAGIAYGITDIEVPVENRPLTLTRNITGGLPPFQLPAFSIDIPEQNRTVSFPEILQTLGSGLAVIPLIGFLESIAIAKAFGRKNKYKIDASQELLAIGVGNLLSSFVASYPITGSFGRSAVNAQSNVMTPLGGIFTGAVVLLALQFLSDAFQYIPAAALGAVIIMAVINLFDFRGMIHIGKVNKLDIVPLVVTFLLCFWDIAYGIIAGIGISILILLMGHARPKAKTSQSGDVVTITIKKGLDFPGAEYIEDKLSNQAEKGECKLVVMDCTNITTLDYSSAEAFFHGAECLKNVGISLKLCGLTVSQERMLKRVGVIKHGVKFYDTVQEAIVHSVSPDENV